MNIGLLLLRMVVCLIMVAHSAQKLFGWFGGPGLTGSAQLMEQLGFRPPRIQAVLAGLVEAGGGMLLGAGLFTPLAATMILSVMMVATAAVHLGKGFFVQNGGYEYNLVLAAAALALAFTGPGSWSVDAYLGIGWPGPMSGLAALGLGLLGGGAQLLARSRPLLKPGSTHRAA